MFKFLKKKVSSFNISFKTHYKEEMQEFLNEIGQGMFVFKRAGRTTPTAESQYCQSMCGISGHGVQKTSRKSQGGELT